MDVFTNQHSPMLSRIRIPPNLLRDLLPQTAPLSKPLPTHARDRMPADPHRPQLSIDPRLAAGDDIRFMAQAERVLQRELALDEFVFPLGLDFVSGYVKLVS